MEELAKSPDTPAGVAATERLIAASLDPELYPDGTAFLPSDAPDLAEMIAAGVAEDRPLAIVYPNGNTQLATPAHGALIGLVFLFVTFLLTKRDSERRKIRDSSGAELVALPARYVVEFRHERAVAA